MSERFHMNEILPYAEFEFGIWANTEKQQIILILSNKNSEAEQQLLLMLTAPFWDIIDTQIMNFNLAIVYDYVIITQIKYKTFHLSRKFSSRYFSLSPVALQSQHFGFYQYRVLCVSLNLIFMGLWSMFSFFVFSNLLKNMIFHFVECIRISFLFMVLVFHYNIPQFICLFTRWWASGCFHYGNIMNKGVMNDLKVIIWICFTSFG